MLERVLEPEVMDSYEEADGYNSMDHSAVNVAFAEDLLAAGYVGGDTLDLGTGTALIPIQIARRVPQCRIMAVDLSVNMLELARYNLEAAGVTAHVQLGQVDGKALPYPDNMFDAVVSNSIIHHLAEPVTCLREAIRVTKPGGLVFFRDLTRPDNLAKLEHLVQTYVGCEQAHAQQMFRESLHAALDLAEIRELISSLGFSPNSVQATTDRHWTWTAQKPN
jgi:ubiquinone/menaquinone biosynthesis C-methylase UbiE